MFKVQRSESGKLVGTQLFISCQHVLWNQRFLEPDVAAEFLKIRFQCWELHCRTCYITHNTPLNGHVQSLLQVGTESLSLHHSLMLNEVKSDVPACSCLPLSAGEAFCAVTLSLPSSCLDSLGPISCHII